MTIDIADRGPGVPADVGARVFDRFTRGRHAGIPGAGLGLVYLPQHRRRARGDADAVGAARRRAQFRLVLPLPESPPALPGGEREPDVSEKRRAS